MERWERVYLKFKKLILFMTVLIFIMALYGCGGEKTNSSSGGGGEDDKKITLKLATYYPSTSPVYTDFTEPWMKRVTELTKGKVEFDYYPSEQLGKAGDLLQLTADGVADISIYPSNYYPNNMPYSHIFAAFPNLSETAEQGTLAYNELLQENQTILETDFLKNGVRPIVSYVSPPYEIWTTGKEIRVPSDLKGRKVKTAGGTANEFFEFIGAVPVTISHSETYEALERGIVDISITYAMAIESSGTQDLLKYAIFPHVGSVIHSININEKVWQGLPEDVQKAMIQAGEEIIEPIGQIYQERTEKFNEEFIEKGGVIVELTKEELQEWRTKSDEFIQKWLDKHKSDSYQYEDVLNAYREKMEKYK